MNNRLAAFVCGIVILLGCSHENNDIYTVVISLDAFRWDYPDVCDTPNINAIADEGISCTMEPSYPASTFPNHYTIATGLVPDHHGIINGSFWNPDTQKMFSMGDSTTRYNPAYYLGEPIWVTAEKSGVKTACIYWVGSDVPVQGILPTYSYPWYETPHLTFEERAAEAVRLLSLSDKERPRLVMLYFDEPDATSHDYGPLASETKSIIRQLDSLVGNMYRQLRALPYRDRINVIITSDHGMAHISPERFIDWDDFIKPEWCERIVATNPTNIFVTKEQYADSVVAALSAVEHISVWRHNQVPAELQYGTSNRCGDVIVAPDLGWQFASDPKNKIGAHGYSPKEKEMQVPFIAVGPSFQSGCSSIDYSFRNVDIYAMLADILGICPAPTDGDLGNTSVLRCH